MGPGASRSFSDGLSVPTHSLTPKVARKHVLGCSVRRGNLQGHVPRVAATTAVQRDLNCGPRFQRALESPEVSPPLTRLSYVSEVRLMSQSAHTSTCFGRTFLTRQLLPENYDLLRHLELRRIPQDQRVKASQKRLKSPPSAPRGTLRPQKMNALITGPALPCKRPPAPTSPKDAPFPVDSRLCTFSAVSSQSYAVV